VDFGKFPINKDNISQNSLSQVQINIDSLKESLDSISRGNLSYMIISSEKHSDIEKSVNNIVTRLRELISKIMRFSVILSSASGKWTDTSWDLNKITERYVIAVEELVTDNKLIVKSVSEAKLTLERIDNEYVNQSQKIIAILEEKMKNNLNLMTTLSDSVSILDKKMEDITLITETINKIANETNLLALNASIEAARAGKEGKAFNVVAEEVKNLATNTLSSSKDIMKVISDVQKGFEEVASDVEKTQMIVDEEQETVKNVSNIFDNLVVTTKEI